LNWREWFNKWVSTDQGVGGRADGAEDKTPRQIIVAILIMLVWWFLATIFMLEGGK
jgi:hypothetical protein